jgi:hypothetical protein
MAHVARNYDPTRRYDVQTRDVAYRRDGGRSWLAMIYQPQGPGPFPAVLDVHFVSSLPVMQRPACKAWADTRPVQIV